MVVRGKKKVWLCPKHMISGGTGGRGRGTLFGPRQILLRPAPPPPSLSHYSQTPKASTRQAPLHSSTLYPILFLVPPQARQSASTMSTCSEAPEQPGTTKLKPSPLCQTCLALFLPLEAHPEEVRVGFSDGGIVVRNVYHKCFETWDSAVKASCYLCCQVRDNLPVDVLEIFAGNHATPGGMVKYWPDTNLDFPTWISISLDHDRVGKETTLWSLELAPKTAESEPRNTFQLGWAEVGAVSPTWDYIGKWIQTCTSSHQSCRPPTSNGSKSYFPTRLLDLGNHPDDGIRLIDTAENNPNGAYTTLSHRWGGTNPVHTVRENIEDFKKDIALPLLSKTFRDAIQVTRRLGFRYIWIDSLCIIQDDADDWAQEAASMGGIYHAAILNIAAASTDDPEKEGLFLDDNRSLAPPIMVRCGGVDVEAYHPRIPKREIDQGPLQQVGVKAWCLEQMTMMC